MPADDTTGDRRVFWRLQSHQINATRILVDGQVETTGGGSHTANLAYSDLDDYRGERHSLTLEAEITVTLKKHVRTGDRYCRTKNNTTSCRTGWDDEYTYPTETVRVSDSTTVEEYDLAVSGFVARYPNGDLRLVVYRSDPWLGHSVPNSDVRGVWRFYSARDSDWDTLVRSTDDGSTRTHSPLHPLQMNAFPMETGPSASTSRVIILASGEATQPPSLPPNVNLNVVTEPYTASYGIATRTATEEASSGLQAWGLVRGVTVDADDSDFAQIEIHRSNLTLSTVNLTENATTVRVRLEDAATGEPINTAGRDGCVVLDGQRLNTTGNGTATVIIARLTAVVSARYEPGEWWLNTPEYVGDSAKIHVGGTALELIVTLSRFFSPGRAVLAGHLRRRSRHAIGHLATVAEVVIRMQMSSGCSLAVRVPGRRMAQYAAMTTGFLVAAVQPAVAQDGGDDGGGLLDGLGDIIIGALTELLRILFSPIRSVIEDHGNALLDLVVGTPHPDSVFSAPTNGPRPNLYSYYWETMVPLSLSLYGLAIGFVILFESTSHLFSSYHRTKLKKRAFPGLLGILS